MKEKNEEATCPPGTKHDAGKLQWSLLPWQAVKEIVAVLTFGARKYAPDNWKKVENPKDRYFDAMMRHIEAWKEGEQRDPESKLHHLAHACCCALFMMWFEIRHQTGWFTIELKSRTTGTFIYEVPCWWICDECKQEQPAWSGAVAADDKNRCWDCWNKIHGVTVCGEEIPKCLENDPDREKHPSVWRQKHYLWRMWKKNCRFEYMCRAARLSVDHAKVLIRLFEREKKS